MILADLKGESLQKADKYVVALDILIRQNILIELKAYSLASSVVPL